MMALCVCNVADGGAARQAASTLSIVPEMKLTNDLGVFIISQLVQLSVGDNVKIRKTDGTEYTGKVTEVKEDDQTFKVYGEVHNVDDTHFGFVMNKRGVFAGAVLEKKTNKVFTIEFSLEHKGYILMRSFKYDKPLASGDKFIELFLV